MPVNGVGMSSPVGANDPILGTDTTNVVCPFDDCSKNNLEFGNIDDLINHLCMKHFTGYTPYRCKMCQTSMTTHEQAVMHVRYRHHRPVDSDQWIIYHGDNEMEKQISGHVERALDASRASSTTTGSNGEHIVMPPDNAAVVSQVKSSRKLQSVTDKLLKAASQRRNCLNDAETTDATRSATGTLSDYDDMDQRDTASADEDVTTCEANDYCQLCQSRIEWTDSLSVHSLRQTRMLHVLKVHMHEKAYYCATEGCDFSSNDHNAVRAHGHSQHQMRTYRRRLTNLRITPEFTAFHKQCFGVDTKYSKGVIVADEPTSDVCQRPSSTPSDESHLPNGMDAAAAGISAELAAQAINLRDQLAQILGLTGTELPVIEPPPVLSAQVESSPASQESMPVSQDDKDSGLVGRQTCAVCHASITGRNNYLRQHAMTHSDVLLYKCTHPNCHAHNVEFKDHRSARTHEKSIHKTIEEHVEAKLASGDIDALVAKWQEKCFGDADMYGSDTTSPELGIMHHNLDGNDQASLEEPVSPPSHTASTTPTSKRSRKRNRAQSDTTQTTVKCGVCGTELIGKRGNMRGHAHSHLTDQLFYCSNDTCMEKNVRFKTRKAAASHCLFTHGNDQSTVASKLPADQIRLLIDKKMDECFGEAQNGSQPKVTVTDEPAPTQQPNVPAVSEELLASIASALSANMAALSNASLANLLPPSLSVADDGSNNNSNQNDTSNSSNHDHNSNSTTPRKSITSKKAVQLSSTGRTGVPMVSCSLCGLAVQDKSNNKKQHAHIHIPNKMFYCAHPKCAQTDVMFSARRLCHSHCMQYHAAGDNAASYVRCQVTDAEFRSLLNDITNKCFPMGQGGGHAQEVSIDRQDEEADAEEKDNTTDLDEDQDQDDETGQIEDSDLLTIDMAHEPEHVKDVTTKPPVHTFFVGCRCAHVYLCHIDEGINHDNSIYRECQMCRSSIKRDSRTSHAQSHNSTRFFYCTAQGCVDRALHFKTRRAIREHCNKSHKGEQAFGAQTETDEHVKAINDQLFRTCFPTSEPDSQWVNEPVEPPLLSSQLESSADEDASGNDDTDDENTPSYLAAAGQAVHTEECRLCEAMIVVHKSSCRRLHAQTHLMQKLYFCGYAGCGLQFQTRASIRKHVRKFHGNKSDFVRVSCTEKELNEKIVSLTELCFGGKHENSIDNDPPPPLLEGPPSTKRARVNGGQDKTLVDDNVQHVTEEESFI